jgi:hypothetical protein
MPAQDGWTNPPDQRRPGLSRNECPLDQTRTHVANQQVKLLLGFLVHRRT